MQTYSLEFDLGSDFPYAAQVADIDLYAAWEPLQINGGGETNYGAYYINSNGLQFTTTPGEQGTNNFGGWLVCQWSRGVPQLFVKSKAISAQIPSSCAEVQLKPHYI